MNAPPPTAFTWDGDAMVPRSARFADRYFVVGETYTLVTHEERSKASHDHYFVRLGELFDNLPESVSQLYPSIEHLRKRALVDAGFYDEEIIDCGSNKVAPNVAAAIRKRDDFAVIFIRDQFVIVRTAKSQSMRAMKKGPWEDSKRKVLEIVEAMVGVKPDQVGNAA